MNYRIKFRLSECLLDTKKVGMDIDTRMDKRIIVIFSVYRSHVAELLGQLLRPV